MTGEQVATIKNVVEAVAVGLLGWLTFSVHQVQVQLARMDERTSGLERVWTADQQVQFERSVNVRFEAVQNRLDGLEGE